MKTIKEILIYSSEFPPGPGGIGNHAYNLANHLSKFHYKITVLAPIRSEFENNDKKISNEAKFELINMGKRKLYPTISKNSLTLLSQLRGQITFKRLMLHIYVIQKFY